MGTILQLDSHLKLRSFKRDLMNFKRDLNCFQDSGEQRALSVCIHLSIMGDGTRFYCPLS